jgi:chromatin segregation and condensation protein Rec8/ScpA/Scc1 (kleisin family)
MEDNTHSGDIYRLGLLLDKWGICNQFFLWVEQMINYLITTFSYVLDLSDNDDNVWEY